MKLTHCCILIYINMYSVTKILRKIRAITFTENTGNYVCEGDERTLLPFSLARATL